MTEENRSPEGIAEMFADCQSWLEEQPGIKPLIESQSRLCQQLDEWLVEYSNQVCEQVIDQTQNAHKEYIERLWQCWSHHWQQAIDSVPEKCFNGQEVAQQIRDGRGFVRGRRLGGDPLRDVVLAVAMTNKDGRAPAFFETDYLEFSVKVASAVHPQFKYDADDWWNEFLDFLAGYTNPPGKLDRFYGKCALRNWLGVVLRNFLRRRRILLGEDHDGDPEPIIKDDSDLERAECLLLFQSLIAEALARLSVVDRLLLKLLFVDGLLLKETASILGIHSGNAGRGREKAIDRLQNEVSKVAIERDQDRVRRDCEELMLEPGQGDVFWEALATALKSICEEESS